MSFKTRRILILGVALFIFGPVLGWVLSIAGLFQTASSMQQSVLQTPPGILPDIGQTMGQTTSNMFISLIPLLIGAVCGATGLFLCLYAFITHFFRTEDDA